MCKLLSLTIYWLAANWYQILYFFLSYGKTTRVPFAAGQSVKTVFPQQMYYGIYISLGKSYPQRYICCDMDFMVQ